MQCAFLLNSINMVKSDLHLPDSITERIQAIAVQEQRSVKKF